MGEKNSMTWKTEEKTLTLCGERVLELSMTWPKWGTKGPKGPQRYYEKLARRWKERWGRELYWSACADLAQKREASRPFTPWRASLTGELKLERDDMFSISMTAREVRGDGRALEYRWGDTWRRDGSIVVLKDIFGGKKGWKRELLEGLRYAAETARKNGVCLDDGAEGRLGRRLSESRFVLTEEGAEFYFPQCTLAPAVEGVVTLVVPLPEGFLPEQEKEA